MTLDTTRALIETVLETVADIGHVHLHPRVGIIREEEEAKLLTGSSPTRKVQVWEIQTAPEVFHDGCGGLHRTELEVSITGWWYVDDSGASREEFATRIRDVSLALMDPITGFAQILEPGISVVIDDGPTKLRSGHAAWRGTLDFRLLDVVTT